MFKKLLKSTILKKKYKLCIYLRSKLSDNAHSVNHYRTVSSNMLKCLTNKLKKKSHPQAIAE